jgi:hypothetical protein
MKIIAATVIAILIIPLSGWAVTEQLCPMLKVTTDRDFELKLEDVEIIFRCQETFPIDLPGFGEIQFKPDIIDEYHQIDLDDEKHERELELLLKPEFPDCSGWEFSILQGQRRFPLKERDDRARWWLSLKQDCIPLLPNYFKHEEREFPHDPKDNRIEDELSFEVESVIDGETTLGRKFSLENRRFPNDPEDNRLRLVSQAELEWPFCSDSVTSSILLERQQFPHDPERNHWEIRSSIEPTCSFNAFTLKTKFETRRFPNDPKQDWGIRKFTLEAEKELEGATLNARAYWQHYRRPNYPSSSTNRDEFWLRFIGEKSYEDTEIQITSEWRWRDVPVKPENDRLIKISEIQLIGELSPLVDLLFDLHLEDKDYPNDPEDDELDTRILAGFKLNF